MSVTRDPAARFWPKVDQNSPSGCWLWTAGLDTKGYGKFYDGERIVAAYRWAWTLTRGPVPAGLELDHLCRNRLCVNPDHLEVVTHAENMRRTRKAACVKGHAYDEANTREERKGRACRACARDQARQRRAKGAAA